MPKKTIPRKKKRSKISPQDLFRLRVATGLEISPDEKQVAYCIERMDEKELKYFTNIHMLDVATGKSHQFTHGNQADGQPVWSHDGTQLAFVSTRDKKTGIYLMPASGGAERKLLEIEGMLSCLQWSPDDKHLVFGLQYHDSHFIKDEKKKKEPPVFRHITRFWFRLDGLGYLPQDSAQIHVLNIETAKLRKVTKGKRDNRSPHVSPNGQWITFVSNRSKDPDLEGLRDDLFVIPFEGGKERKVSTPAGPIHGPRFSPDSKTVAYLGHDNPNDAWGVTNVHIWKVGLNNRPAARDLMPKFDNMAYDSSINDVSDFHGEGQLFWSADGRRLYFGASDTGATNIYSVPAGGGHPNKVFAGKCHVKGFSVNGRTRTATFIYSDLKNPGEIMTCPLTVGAEKRAVLKTDLNPFLRTDIDTSKMREVWFKSFDGTNIQGWVVLPPGFKPTHRYPAILQIHGGPRAQYAFTYFHEMQYLAACGYVIFYTNPRGGSGRGETWADAIAGGWGDLDYRDCMAAADWLEKQKYVNSKRMGVTGGSYGGYMTNWMIGHTNRFKAAVTQRSIADLKSFVGSSDCGFELQREFDGWPWTNPENYEKCSPITYYRKVKTPVLIIHSEQDLRCHIEQAEQMFVMLKALGKKVEMVRFPEEPHGLSRHGRPDRRIARLEWIRKWFDRYLRGK
ncbi:MAG: S9 family peptidase [candidate division Zixibacteria bacterium]|nr:S9 family peptidase [candidate division Zixibacteria bacterium]